MKKTALLVIILFLISYTRVDAGIVIDRDGKVVSQPNASVLGVNTDFDENELNDKLDSINFDESEAEIELDAMEDKLVVGSKLETDEKVSIEEPEVKTKVSVSANDGEIEIESNGTKAETDLDVSIRKSDNEVLIKREDGQTEVRIKPDELEKIVSVSNTADRLDLTNKIKLKWDVESKSAVYLVYGVSDEKLFGVKPVELKKEILISAQDGKLLSVYEDLKTRIVDWFSF